MRTIVTKTISIREQEAYSIKQSDEEIKRLVIIEMIRKIDFKELEKVFKIGFVEDSEYKRFAVELITKD